MLLLGAEINSEIEGDAAEMRLIGVSNLTVMQEVRQPQQGEICKCVQRPS
jgi:hypothetical protein